MNDEPREIFAASIQLRRRAERGVKALLKRRVKERGDRCALHNA